jgi:hypothetical protein
MNHVVGIVVSVGLGMAACNSGSSSTSGTSDSGSSDSSSADDGGGARSEGGTGDALAGNDGMGSGRGSSGSSSGSSSSGGPTDVAVPRTDSGKTDQGCVTHADCAPGYFCYLGATSPTSVCGGPAGSCATCQGGTCPPVFECSCLLASLCSMANPCTDDGKVIVCQQQPQKM